MVTIMMPPAAPERADRLAYYLNKSITKADKRFRLLGEGDRILVAVSGGKDSLSLLDLLQRRQTTSRVHYALVAATCAAMRTADVPKTALARGLRRRAHHTWHLPIMAVADQLDHRQERLLRLFVAPAQSSLERRTR